jgi:8-oxo-dGTP pyrophosphatase MutT (NUDIX family)
MTIYKSSHSEKEYRRDERKSESKGKGDKRTVTYSGTLTVSGEGDIKIPCRGRPLEVEVGFCDPVPPKAGCGNDAEDIVEIEIDHILKPFPLWAVKIAWEIHSGNVREISWSATVLLNGRM